MTPIIEVHELSKRYRFGHSVQRTATARELVMRALAAPFRRRTAEVPSSEAFFWALKDIDFQVNAGEIVGIIGANGAGKSTMLKILSRITDPTEGSITLRGRMASLLEVGTGFHPELTGRENIFLNGAVLGMRNAEIKERFDEIVAFAEVEKFLDTPVKHYSSGMSVRLGFAVAAHLQPEILVVDEVLAVGDMAFQKKCLGKMSEVSKTGRTILFVSHNMAAVENLCQRGIVLEKGRLVYDGDVKSSIARYMAHAHQAGEGEGSVIDLTAASTRKPKFNPILRKVSLSTNGGQPAPRAVTLGSSLRLDLSLRLPANAPGFRCGIGFNSVFGQRVLTLHTFFAPGFNDEVSAGDTTLTCEIPSLTLVPGEYFIFLYVDFGTERKDAIPDAFMLSVLDSDYYGTGKPPFSGVVVMPHRWNMAPSTQPAADDDSDSQQHATFQNSHNV